jgi:ankyrin repeat protein
MLSRSCLSYLLQGFLSAGPCTYPLDLYFRATEHHLASYSSFYFDSHLRPLLQVPDDLRELLKAFLSRGSMTLTAAMQLRALHGVLSGGSAIIHFITPLGIGASAVIHSTTLLDHPCFRGDTGGWTPDVCTAHGAASAGRLSDVILLIQGGNPVDEMDSENQTPLHHASMNGHQEVCRYLLEQGADVAAKDKDGRTPLYCAASGGHGASVQLLVMKGADITTKDREGVPLLHVAILGGHETVVRLLVV